MVAANLLHFPLPPSIPKQRLTRCAKVRKQVEAAWRELLNTERQLRKQETLLNELESWCDLEENQIRDALAAGAEIVE